MATAQGPLPPPNLAVTGPGAAPTQVYAIYLQSLDQVVRALAAANLGPLTQVAAPSNANAAAAGVPVNGLYATTADPHIVYIRTA
jgi:hypothetical protein